MTFYPNPITNGVLNVVAGATKLQTVALFDLNGKKIISLNTKNSPQNLAIPTQGLAKGVYILELTSEKNKLIKKVVVN
ncbi:MAG: T9SS C-terminal target domain-containing protein [Sphingobacteriales bacterium]|nr:MAG: T9SS C-terminal target domain-containing protein [Sphingobacteriales bacterium]